MTMGMSRENEGDGPAGVASMGSTPICEGVRETHEGQEV
jgi:hypothetical protein